MSYRVTGGDDLQALTRDLKAAGSQLNREIPKGMRKAAKPMVRDIRAEALSSLPQRGGLAAHVAKSGIRVSTRASGVSVVGKRTKRGGLTDLEAINDGVVRHRVFDAGEWVAQSVRPGFWDRPVEHHEATVTREMLGVIDDVRRRFEAGG